MEKWSNRAGLTKDLSLSDHTGLLTASTLTSSLSLWQYVRMCNRPPHGLCFLLMAQKKYFAFCTVPFTFVQVASKFIGVSFYLYSSLALSLSLQTRLRHRDIRWLAWNPWASEGQLKLESDLS